MTTTVAVSIQGGLASDFSIAMNRTAGSRHAWFGFLNVNKPRGWTSRQVVDHVKRLVRPAKVGHAGTLDPLAEGVLVICLGTATRLVPFIHGFSKTYQGEFLCGQKSDTDDIEGNVQELSNAPEIRRSEILEVLPHFLGRIAQTPPAFSAVKIKGKRAYTMARRGQTPELPPRDVDIHRLQLTEFDPPRVRFEVECSTGTYIRVLGRDIARAVGSDAVMSSLIRTRIGPFEIDSALSPEQLTSEALSGLVVPASAAVSHLRSIVCDDVLKQELQHGRPVPVAGRLPQSGELCAALSPEGELLAIGEFQPATGQMAPRHVFV